tara:strand:+ start:627 stop:728 length:102 start_codon:yes stop_codon:yes gene_type:complete
MTQAILSWIKELNTAAFAVQASVSQQRSMAALG